MTLGLVLFTMLGLVMGMAVLVIGNLVTSRGVQCFGSGVMVMAFASLVASLNAAM